MDKNRRDGVDMRRARSPLVVGAVVLAAGWMIAAGSVFVGWRSTIANQAAQRIDLQAELIAQHLRSCSTTKGKPCGLEEVGPAEILANPDCQSRIIPDSLRVLPEGDPPAERYFPKESLRFLVSEKPLAPGHVLQLRRPLSSIIIPRSALLIALAASLTGTLLPFLLLAGLLRRERSRTAHLVEVARAADQGRPIPETPSGVSGEEFSLVASLAADLRRRRILSKWEERRLARLLDSLSEGVLLLDSRLRVLVCNASGARALGVKRAKAAVRGRPIVSLTRNLGFLDDLRRAVSRSSPIGFDVQDQSRVFSTRVWPVPADPERGGWLVTIQDVTAQRRAEHLQSRLVSDASHEFKTPLTSIRGWTETLLEDEEDEFRRNALERVAQGTRHLEEVVRDLLDLGRIAETNMQIRDPVSLESVCTEAISALDGEATRRGVHLTLNSNPTATVAGFRGQLVRAVINLLSNAIRYSPVGSPVTVSILEAKDTWNIEVSDHGPGIAPDSIPHLFERFYRADHGRSRDLGGTGLGLAIVQDTARAHGGHAEVESVLGTGSCFRILLSHSNSESAGSISHH